MPPPNVFRSLYPSALAAEVCKAGRKALSKKYRRRAPSRTRSNGADPATGRSGEATTSRDVASVLASLGARRAVIMATPALLESEILAGLVDGFAHSGVVLAGINSCPTKGDVDGIVSLGGGSVMRAARETAFAMPGARHAAVPTTLSCVEQFYDPQAPQPDAVVLDARGIQSVPQVQLAAQAFNAMTFAIESVCESNLGDESSAAAIDAVRGLRQGLTSALNTKTLDAVTAMTLLTAAVRAGGAARTAHTGVVRIDRRKFTRSLRVELRVVRCGRVAVRTCIHPARVRQPHSRASRRHSNCKRDLTMSRRRTASSARSAK